MAVDRHVRELDRLAEDLALLDREIAQVAIDDPAVRRLITITGVNLTVAAGIVAAIGDIGRFKSPQKLVSYFGLNPRVRQSGLGVAHHGRISKVGRNAGSSCEPRVPSSRRKRSCGQAIGTDSRKSASVAKRAVEAAIAARLSSSEPSRRKASLARW